MPVLTVTAAPLDSPGAETTALIQLCRAVATALGLGVNDVYAAHVPVRTAVVGEDAVEPWPVVVLHGRQRAQPAMAAALEAVRGAAGEIWGRPSDEVWAQWVVAT